MAFGGESKHRIGGMIREMMGMNSFQRLLRLFEVLREMSLSKEVEEAGGQNAVVGGTAASSADRAGVPDHPEGVFK
ncbi:hypothetical protein ACQ86N_30820 [Puia sp. P3]|uniref:hypothetical protein n=1 Tax=Puia sp. P3 TaxID=3423952 RepID=UPI003D673AC9